MSRAAILIALARVLNRAPEREEYEAFCRELGEGSFLYVPKSWPAVTGRESEVRKLRAEGQSIRHIARATGLSKSEVHRLLSQDCLCFGDTEAA